MSRLWRWIARVYDRYGLLTLAWLALFLASVPVIKACSRHTPHSLAD